MAKDVKLRLLLELLDVKAIYTQHIDQLSAHLRKTLLADQEFSEMAEEVDECVGKIESALDSIKERVCALIEGLYNKFLTEEDIDQLIRIQKMPITKKVRRLQTQITQIVMDKVQAMINEDEKIGDYFKS